MLLLLGSHHMVAFLFRNWGEGKEKKYLESQNLRKEEKYVSPSYHEA